MAAKVNIIVALGIKAFIISAVTIIIKEELIIINCNYLTIFVNFTVAKAKRVKSIVINTPKQTCGIARLVDQIINRPVITLLVKEVRKNAAGPVTNYVN